MTRRPFAAISLAALLILPLAACSSGSGSQSGDSGPMPLDNSVNTQSSAMVADSSHAEGGSASTPQQKSIIRNGSIEITVANTTEAAQLVTDIITDMGGYVESETLRGSGGNSSEPADLTTRIPADTFDAAFEKLASVGEVRAQSRSAADVTAQHVDLQARVGALESSIARLKDLMSGAATTSDLLEAESALSARQQELDGLQAQLSALEDQVDLASIWVRLSTESVIAGGPGNFWDGLTTGWNSLAQALAGAIVVAGILLPWLLPVAVVVGILWLITRGARRRKRIAAQRDVITLEE